MALVLDGTLGITTNSGTAISASTIGVGGATPSTSGAGITFPATASASTNANTLDDYEEGTWTPVFEGNSGGTYTYNYRGGNYTKIGRYVIAWFYMDITVVSAAGSVLGSVTVSSLPFVPASNNLTNSVYTRGGYATRCPSTSGTLLVFNDNNPNQASNIYWRDITASATYTPTSGIWAGYLMYEAA